MSVPPLVDLHCHFVPGVDDGARDVNDAIAQLTECDRQGIKTVVTTPHLAASAALARAAVGSIVRRPPAHGGGRQRVTDARHQTALH